jgi:hypothetical protein
MGLAWKLMVEGRSLKYKAKHRGLCTEYWRISDFTTSQCE